MLLNIYLISHPIIKLLSRSIITSQINQEKYDYNSKYIGLFLMYEIMRKYIKIKPIYIKQISYTKEIYMLNKNQEYYVITNLLNTYQTIGELQILIPNIKILHIDNNKQLFDINIIKKINTLNKNIHIIIFDNILQKSWIIELIEQLTNENNIYITDIHIACIACYNQLLEKLGQKYPSLNLYTTKII
uniref:Uracil phosphoribosyltransferase n=1 Tax=Dasya binghamiae TaxID=1896963 RepID=A0A1C8XRW5_9FLOR|nr:uracil phosphoribosyltransferase [Dasya binghamiae]AOH77240.1 uracil phosphoribosyltransferase [Dasya binghamiae]